MFQSNVNHIRRIVICKHCNQPEYYEEMRWLNGKCGCRNCYKSWYEELYNKLYCWNDLDSERPTFEQYYQQESLYNI